MILRLRSVLSHNYNEIVFLLGISLVLITNIPITLDANEEPPVKWSYELPTYRITCPGEVTSGGDLTIEIYFETGGWSIIDLEISARSSILVESPTIRERFLLHGGHWDETEGQRTYRLTARVRSDAKPGVYNITICLSWKQRTQLSQGELGTFIRTEACTVRVKPLPETVAILSTSKEIENSNFSIEDIRCKIGPLGASNGKVVVEGSVTNLNQFWVYDVRIKVNVKYRSVSGQKVEREFWIRAGNLKPDESKEFHCEDMPYYFPQVGGQVFVSLTEIAYKTLEEMLRPWYSNQTFELEPSKIFINSSCQTDWTYVYGAGRKAFFALIQNNNEFPVYVGLLKLYLYDANGEVIDVLSVPLQFNFIRPHSTAPAGCYIIENGYDREVVSHKFVIEQAGVWRMDLPIKLHLTYHPWDNKWQYFEGWVENSELNVTVDVLVVITILDKEGKIACFANEFIGDLEPGEREYWETKIPLSWMPKGEAWYVLQAEALPIPDYPGIVSDPPIPIPQEVIIQPSTEPFATPSPTEEPIHGREGIELTIDELIMLIVFVVIITTGITWKIVRSRK